MVPSALMAMGKFAFAPPYLPAIDLFAEGGVATTAISSASGTLTKALFPDGLDLKAFRMGSELDAADDRSPPSGRELPSLLGRSRR